MKETAGLRASFLQAAAESKGRQEVVRCQKSVHELKAELVQGHIWGWVNWVLGEPSILQRHDHVVRSPKHGFCIGCT